MRARRWGTHAAVWLVLAGLLCAPRATAQTPEPTADPPEAPQPPARQAGEPLLFSEGIQVFELTVPVRVMGPDGRPVEGLGAEDFLVRVGDREVPIRAVTWIDPVDPEIRELARLSEKERRELGLERFVPGRLVVLFFQTDPNAVRIKGHMSFLRELPELLAAFAPEDRLAVVGFDSHLKLWQDFTTRRQAVLEVAEDAFRFGARPEKPRQGDVPESLAETFDFQAARKAAVVEEALAVTARALAPFEAEKILVFLGWGVGHNTSQALAEGYRALFAADLTMHVLDITYAEAHSLAFPLAGMARATGGVYAATHEFPASAIREVAMSLAGHYDLSLDGDALPPEGGRVEVVLRDPERGRVQAKDFQVVMPGAGE